MSSHSENSSGKEVADHEKAQEVGNRHIQQPGGPLLPGGVKEVALLAYPVVLSQLSVTLMGVVDAAMVGRLGPVELAAVGFGGNWMWTLFCFFMGTAGVVQTFVSQNHGSGEPEQCGNWSWQGAWMLLPLTVLMGLLLYVGLNPLLSLVLPSENMRPIAETYMSIRILGEVGMVSGFVFAAFFRGVGDTRTPLYATLFANLINLVLDYGLIFGEWGLPKWGVAGAATATVVSEWAFAILMIALFLRSGKQGKYKVRPTWINWSQQKRLMRTGFPIGGQWATEMIFFSVFLTLVAQLGDNAMAASQAFIALLSLSFMQAVGVGVAVSTLVGQYAGSKKHEYVENSFLSGQKIAFGISLLIAGLFLFFPGLLMQIFTDSPEVITMGRSLLALGAIYQVIDAVCIVTDNALRGAGDTKVPFLARLILSVLVLIPLSWYLGFYTDGGLTGLWLASGIDLLVLGIFLVLRFRSGAWKKIQI